MAKTYTTIQGDTWDLIAWKLFGEEKQMKYLYEANWQFADTLVFSAGTVLTVPELPEGADEDAPYWRQDDDEDDEEYFADEDEDEDSEDEDDDEDDED